MQVLSLAFLALFFGQLFICELDFFFFSSDPTASGPVSHAEILHSRKAFSPEILIWTLGLVSAASGEQGAQTERLLDSHVLLKQCTAGCVGSRVKKHDKPPYIYISIFCFLHHSGVSILWDVICQNIWISLAAVNCCLFWTVESVSGVFG